MGVEVHLGAMVTDMDDDGVRDHPVRRVDRARSRPRPRSGRPGPALRAWRAPRRDGRRRPSTRRAASGSNPDCSRPGAPRGVRRGRPDGPATTSRPWPRWPCSPGAHAAHTIVRRLKGNDVTRPFHYRDLGTLAVISRFRAVAKIGPLQVGGFLGWLLWLVVHVTFLTGFKNRFGALTRWAVSFVGRGRYERALTGRWTVHERQPSEESA